MLPGLIVLLFVVSATLAPWIAPYNPSDLDMIATFDPPSWEVGGTVQHLLGTDQLGRDELSRLLYGARFSLFVSLVAIAGAGAVGTALGLLAGYLGGITDSAVMRVVDAFLALPFILVALSFVAALGVSMGNLIIVMALTNWARYSRLVRGETLKVKQLEFVALARVAGQSSWKIAFRHVLPNVLNSILVLVTLDVGRVIILESSLSFLGLGVQPPDISWGLMLADGRPYLTHSWWLCVLPGVAILLTVLGFNLIGDWLRDHFDPRQQMD